jgi:hypothetical protein
MGKRNCGTRTVAAHIVNARRIVVWVDIIARACAIRDMTQRKYGLGFVLLRKLKVGLESGFHARNTRNAIGAGSAKANVFAQHGLSLELDPHG